MTDHLARAEHLDSSASVNPEKTNLVAGPGIVIRGDIVSEIEDPDNRILVLGRVEGDINTKGILQIAKGAMIAGNSLIEADTIIVSGSIYGDSLTVKARLLVLQPTARVIVSKVNLATGGLEQQRGSVLDARLTMADDLAAVVHAVPAAPVLTSAVKATELPASQHAKPIFEAPKHFSAQPKRSFFFSPKHKAVSSS